MNPPQKREKKMTLKQARELSLKISRKYEKMWKKYLKEDRKNYE